MREKAAQLEKEFIGAFEAQLRLYPHLVDPRDGKRYSLRRARIERRDRQRALVSALRAQGSFRRKDLFSYPLGRSVVLRFRRLFSPLRFVLAGASLTSFEDYLPEGETRPRGPLGPEEAGRFLAKIASGPQCLAICGLFSATGFTPGTLQAAPEGAKMCLVSPGEEGTWIVRHNLPASMRRYRWFFDPEGEQGRIARAVEAFLRRRELSVEGGFVRIDEVACGLGLDPELQARVLARLCEERPQLCVEEVDGVPILKHKRV